LNYLNLACGTKFHEAWVNVDMVPSGPSVIQCDLLKGINFPDDTFNVVYHSQFIEHIPRDRANFITKECYRVLKPGGIIRVVTPDLENIVRNYLFYLEKCISEPNEINIANYDWLLLEMYDQTIRNYCGGEMGKVLGKENLPNEQFVFDRTGLSGQNIRKAFSEKQDTTKIIQRVKEGPGQIIHKIFRKLGRIYLKAALSRRGGELLEIGKFRVSGEIHYWMYDRVSLSKLLKETGFKDISQKTPYESDIPNWSIYELDVKGKAVIDPASLFMEARK